MFPLLANRIEMLGPGSTTTTNAAVVVQLFGIQTLHIPTFISSPKGWSLSLVPRLRQLIYVIDDVDKRQLVLDVCDAFERQVLPNEARFSSGFRVHFFNL